MRNSKKCTSIVLILVILILSVGGFSVSAEEYTVPDTFIYGDVDFDGDVTVRDATAIQKSLADIVYLTGVQKYLADPNAEGFSIKNATSIQKYVADIDEKTELGAEIIMEYTDKFSAEIPDDPLSYEVDTIIFTPKQNDIHMYTLEDFPEYEFSGIRKITYSDDFPDYYVLTLKEPSTENVIAAIKALDYRANLDLKSIFVNGITWAD